LADGMPTPSMVAVFLGGATGTIARAGIAAVTPASSGWSWSTIAVNVLGAGITGFTVAYWGRRPPSSPRARPLVVGGFAGGLTTFSTFLLDVDRLVRAGRFDVAVLFFATCALGGGAAFQVGRNLGSGIVKWSP
jgi:fluoride exporter